MRLVNRTLAAGLATALGLSLAACAPSAGTPADDTTTASASSGDGHGAVAGAAEVAEPPLHLVTVTRDGGVERIDLVDLARTEIGRTDPPLRVDSDGRYVFVDTGDAVDIVDSGVWSWDHVDHFHYYRADGGVLGSIQGSDAQFAFGASATAGGTAVRFADEVVMLDNTGLASGEITEVLRQSAVGVAIIAPLGSAVVIADGATVGALTTNGDPIGEAIPCPDPAGTIATRVGVVVGCADGAVLAQNDSAGATLVHIALPQSDAPRAMSFAGRKGRPTVAGVAGDSGFWLLDTRDRAWQFVASDPLVEVAAIDNADDHVVALDTAGRVQVFAGGVRIGMTDQLVPADAWAGVSLWVDERRAYLAVPGRAVAYEIDFADAARVAREIPLPAGVAFVAEVGR